MHVCARANPPACLPNFCPQEDSLGSVFNLVPKPPKAQVSTDPNSGRELRFCAVLAQPREEDKGRSFVVSFHIADSTTSIYENPLRNSGFVGGKFLLRGRHKSAATGQPFKREEFALGAAVTFNGFGFLITDADKFTRSVYGWA